MANIGKAGKDLGDYIKNNLMADNVEEEVELLIRENGLHNEDAPIVVDKALAANRLWIVDKFSAVIEKYKLTASAVDTQPVKVKEKLIDLDALVADEEKEVKQPEEVEEVPVPEESDEPPKPKRLLG